MSKFENLKKLRAECRKKMNESVDNHIKFSVLTLLIGELETASKRDGGDVHDDQVTSAVKKLIKSNNETISLIGEEQGRKFVQENEFLQTILPEEMTEEEIRIALSGTVFDNIGEAMKFMSNNYAGKFDKGMASKIAKQML